MTPLLALIAFAAAQLASPQGAGEKPEAPFRGAAQQDLVGLWADVQGDCSEVTALREDGVFIAPNGGRGTWELADGRLTLSGPGGSFSWTIALEDRDTIVLVEDDGATSRSFRCPGHAVPGQAEETSTI